MRFRIGQKTYTAAAVDRLTLKQLIQVESETADLGRRMTWTELRALSGRIADLAAKDEDAAVADPDWPWFLGLIVWASRVDAGEAITFTDAIDFPLEDFEVIPEPQDRKAPADPTKARRGSGPAASGGAGGRSRKKASTKR